MEILELVFHCLGVREFGHIPPLNRQSAPSQSADAWLQAGSESAFVEHTTRQASKASQAASAPQSKDWCRSPVVLAYFVIARHHFSCIYDDVN